MIDLHCHSSFSDGALTPEELIKKRILYKFNAYLLLIMILLQDMTLYMVLQSIQILK